VKLLLDTCVWGGALRILRAAGHEAIWIGEWETDPGDQAILSLAYAQERTLVTLDKDFGERAILHGEPHCGIVRMVAIPARKQADYCRRVVAKYGSELSRGAIVTVDERRTRIRVSG